MKTNLMTKNSFNPISVAILLIFAGAETANYYLHRINLPVYAGSLIITIFLASSRLIP